MKIVLTDNNIGSENNIYNRNDIADLFPITDIKIEELCKEHKSLLIFPPKIKHSDDRIGSSYILNILNTTNPDQVRLTTNNIMGFIGIGNLQIKINIKYLLSRKVLIPTKCILEECLVLCRKMYNTQCIVVLPVLRMLRL